MIGYLIAILCTLCVVNVCAQSEALDRIVELCRTIREADQNVYNALAMEYKPARNKTLLDMNLALYNKALQELRKIAVDHREDVFRLGKDILDVGLPKYFDVSFAEYKLQDNMDMNSVEIDNIYVYRGKAMEIWTSIHDELGIPWAGE